MKRMTRITALALVMLLAMPLMATFASASAEPVTITFWHGWQGLEADKFQAVIDKFSIEYPNIKVEVLSGTTQEKQLLAMSGGDPFDVGLNMDYYIAQWARNGMLAELDQYVDSVGFDKENVIKSELDMLVIDGKMYGVPYTADVTMMYYNKDILAEVGITEPPKSWSELYDACVKVTKTNASGDYERMGVLFNQPWLYPLQMPYLNGGSFYDVETDTALLNSPEVIEANLFKASLHSGEFDTEKVIKFKSGFGQYASAENPFMKGQLAFAIDGEWFPTFIKEYTPDLNYGVASVPYPDGKPELSGCGQVQAGALFVPVQSKHQQEAFTFINWLVSDGPQIEVCVAKGNLPVTYSALKDPSLIEGAPTLAEPAAVLLQDKLKAIPALPFTSELMAALKLAEDSVYAGTDTVQSAFDAANAEIQMLADEYKAGK